MCQSEKPQNSGKIRDNGVLSPAKIAALPGNNFLVTFGIEDVRAAPDIGHSGTPATGDPPNPLLLLKNSGNRKHQ